jgi:nucleoid-associated protein YgaU
MPGSWSQTLQTNVSRLGNSSITLNPSNSVLGATTASESNTTCNSSYIVKPGDSLWKISSQNLGSGAKYNAIMEQNKLSSTSLRPGQSLKLTCK